MSFSQLFFSFEGRLRRRWFWLGMITITILNILVMYWLRPDFFNVADPDDLEALKAVYKPDWRMTLYSLLILFPVAALIIKRLNDRDRPRWIAYVLLAMSFVYLLLPYIGEDFTSQLTDPTALQNPSTELMAYFAFQLVHFIFALWMLIELGLLRGTRGANQHGPDPKES